MRTTAPHSRGSGGSHSGLTLEHDDTVSQVRSHDEVVFDNERCLLRVKDVPVRQRDRHMSHPRICDFYRTLAYLLITLLAIMRCSESKKLNGDPVRWPPAHTMCVPLTRTVHPTGRY